MSGPGKFSVLSQIKPQAHSWWRPSVGSFGFQSWEQLPPEPKEFDFSGDAEAVLELHLQSLVGIAYG